jgi:hypothetical protein
MRSRTSSCASFGDVAHDADVALRLAEAAAHGEYRKVDDSLFAVLGATDVLAGIVSRSDQLLEDVFEDFFAEIDRGRIAFEIVVGVAEQCEVCAVLLEVETLGIDDRDCFLRVCEDLAIEIGVQLYGPSARLGGRFLSRRLNRHGNALPKKYLKGGFAGYM